jgi:hypothetical protein
LHPVVWLYPRLRSTAAGRDPYFVEAGTAYISKMMRVMPAFASPVCTKMLGLGKEFNNRLVKDTVASYDQVSQLPDSAFSALKVNQLPGS